MGDRSEGGRGWLSWLGERRGVKGYCLIYRYASTNYLLPTTYRTTQPLAVRVCTCYCCDSFIPVCLFIYLCVHPLTHSLTHRRCLWVLRRSRTFHSSQKSHRLPHPLPLPPSDVAPTGPSYSDTQCPRDRNQHRPHAH